MELNTDKQEKDNEPRSSKPIPPKTPGSPDNICRICLKHINEPCGECTALLTKCRCLRDCRVAKGICEHMFHNHCLFPWLAIRRVCPVDLNEWEFQT